MRIQTATDIRSLTAADKDELIAEITIELAAQKEKNDLLKRASDRANQGLTIWKLVTTAVGAVIALAVGVLWFGGEWSAWQAIKEAHKVDLGNGQTAYAHQNFLPADVTAMKTALGMPEMATVALKSEVAALDLTQYVKYSDRFRIQSANSPFAPDFLHVQPRGGQFEAYVVVGGNSQDTWQLIK